MTHKYEIRQQEIPPNGVLQLPQAARLLAIDICYGKMTIWTLVSTEAKLVERRLSLVRIGNEASRVATAAYVGKLHVGPAVLHVFDLGERELSDAAA